MRPAGPYFFYGTLLDPEILQLVVGRRVSPAHTRPAIIADHARYYRKGASYPLLIAAPGETTTGRLVRGLSRRETGRIDEFEDDGYRKLRRRVTTVDGEAIDAWVYVWPTPGAATSREWDYATWCRRERQRFRRRVYARLSRTV